MPSHILIVDDEPQVAFFLGKAVKSTAPEYVVFTSQTGAEALQVARRRKIDLMIIDYRLTDMDGLELTARVRRLNHKPLVIMITAGPLPASGSESDSGIVCCIQKPFSVTQLMAVISEVLHTADTTLASGAAGQGQPASGAG